MEFKTLLAETMQNDASLRWTYKYMRYLILSAVMALPIAGASVPQKKSIMQHDLDGDGVADTIEASHLHINDDNASALSILVNLSRRNSSHAMEATSDSQHLATYPGMKGELIIDHSNRASRDSAELSYYVYRWNEGENSLCLHSHIYGTPANQLNQELISDDLKIALFRECAPFGSEARAHETPLVPLASGDKRLSNVSGSYIPEWAAVEIGEQASYEAFESLMDLASEQRDHKNYASSAIILNGLIRKRIKSSEACALLVEVYSESGYPLPENKCTKIGSVKRTV